MACGKAFWRFYKTGIKNIWANRKLVKTVSARLKKPQNSRAHDLLQMGATRAEYHLLKRSRAELLRVPVFALLLAIFGEWLPLLVIFLTPLIPYNCRIPRQIEKQLAKRQRQRQEARRWLHRTKKLASFVDLQEAEYAKRSEAASDLKRFLFDGLNAGSAISYRLFGQRGISERLDYLMHDTAALFLPKLGPGQIVNGLSDEEVRIAAEERGIDVLGRSSEQVRRDFLLWLNLIRPSLQHSRESQPWVESLLHNSQDLPDLQQRSMTSAIIGTLASSK